MATASQQIGIVQAVVAEVLSFKTPPKPPPKDRTRFYACELKLNRWSCRPTEEFVWKPEADTLATQLVPIASWTPRFLDTYILAQKLKKPVSLTD